jgi:peptidoglycan/LPS O-acetylase OafA/YrhL
VSPTSPKRSTTRRLTSLDGLRGLAALVVVVHHGALSLPSLARQYQAPDPSSPAWWLTYTPLRILWAGGEAVLVFFVLSGLVLCLPFLSCPAPGAWWRYYRKRLLRLYLPVVAAVVLTGFVVSLVPRRPSGDWSWWMVAHAVPADLSALGQDAFLLGGTGWLNSALWSLKYEVFFSLLLPLFVVLVRQLTAPLWLSVPLALWGVGWAVSIDHELLSFMFVFAVGVLLAQRLDSLAAWGARISGSRRASLLWLVVLVGGVLLLLSEWWMKQFVSDWTLWLPVGRPAGVLGAAVLVLAFLHCPAARRLGNTRALQWLGKVSFSLYLVHEPLVVSVATFVPPTARGLPVTLGVGIGVSLVAAVVFFHAVERPSQRFATWVGGLGRRSARIPARAVPTGPAADLVETIRFSARGPVVPVLSEASQPVVPTPGPYRPAVGAGSSALRRL